MNLARTIETTPQVRSLRQIAPLLIIGAIFLAYSNAYKGPFVYDDCLNIELNPTFRTLWPIWVPMLCKPGLATAGRPLSGLSFALNYAMGGLNTWGYHATNIALHALAGLTLWGVIRRTLLGLAHPAADAVALACTLIWAVHPLQTDTVTYIINRQEGLAMLFLLLAIYGLLRSIDSSHRRGWLILSVVSGLAGVCSKENGVMIGPIVLLFDVLFIARSWKILWRTRKWFYAGLLLAWILLPLLISTASFLVKSGGRTAITPWQYLMVQSQVIWMYLRLCFWPSPLVISYSDWPIDVPLSRVLPHMISLAGMVVLTTWLVIRKNQWGILGVVFFLVLAPSSSLWPLASEPAAERRMYLPLICVILLILLPIERWTRKLPRRSWFMAIGCGLLVLVLGNATLERNEAYSSTLSIWLDTVEKRPNNAVAHYALAVEMEQQGYLADARARLEESLRIDPTNSETVITYAQVLCKMNEYQRANDLITRVLIVDPTSTNALTVQGAILYQLGKIDQAQQSFENALRIDPDHAEAARLLKELNKVRQEKNRR